MRYRMLLLAGFLLAGTLAMNTVASAHNSGYRSPSIRNQELSRTRIVGTIETVNAQGAVIISPDGEQYGVALGPRSYWGPRCGNFLRPGTSVSVSAWGDPYQRSDWYFAGDISGPGFSVSFTNDDGVPYWEDYPCSDDWCPTYNVYTDWYDCTPTVYNYILPPPPPVRYYHWYPRGYYPTRYRHYYRSYDYSRHDNGRHEGWNRGRGHDHYDGDQRDGGDYRDRGSNDGRYDQPNNNDNYRGGPRGRRRG